MVQLTSSVLLALLATSVQGHLRYDRRGLHHHKHRRDVASAGTTGSAKVPFPVGNSSEPLGPGTQVISVSSTSIVTSVVTVVPVAASAVAGAGTGAGAGNGAGAAPAPPAGNGAPKGADQCGPATVTVTAANTVTVTQTVAASSSAAAAAPAAPAVVNAAAAKANPNPSPAPAQAAPAPAKPQQNSNNNNNAASQAAAAAAPAVEAKAPSNNNNAASAAAAAAAAAPQQQAKAPVNNNNNAASAAAQAAAAPAAAAAQAKAPSNNSPTSGGNTVGKRGIGYQTPGDATPLKPAWGFNWNANSGGLPSDIEFVPSLQKPSDAAGFAAAIAGSGATHAKCINEPDMTVGGGGTATAPDAGAQLFNTYMVPLKAKGLRVGTPSVTSHNASSGATGAASGIQWLQQFAQACGGCKPDFVDLHWYGNAAQSGSDQAEALKDYINQAAADVLHLFGSGVSIWLSEFSALPTADQNPQVNADFMKAILPFLESSTAVERFSYFQAPFLVSGSSLNVAGKSYSA